MEGRPVVVRSSVYAVPVYERIGFHASGPMIHEGGVMYVPMRLLPARGSEPSPDATISDGTARSVTVRPALESERMTLEALLRRASLVNPEYRHVLLANPDAMRIPMEQFQEGHVFVAERSGCVVGFSVVLPRDDGNAELDGLFVEPDQWRTGIGRTLIQYCARTAKSRGAKALHVIGNPHAEAFYRACGFAQIGVAPTQFGVGLVLMKIVE